MLGSTREFSYHAICDIHREKNVCMFLQRSAAMNVKSFLYKLCKEKPFNLNTYNLIILIILFVGEIVFFVGTHKVSKAPTNSLPFFRKRSDNAFLH